MTMNQASLTFAPPSSNRSAAPDRLPDQLGDWPSLDVEHRGLGREAVAAGISVADERGEWYLPFGHAEGRQHDPAKVRAWAKEHLADKDVIFRAAKNDIEVLRRWGLDLEELNVRPHETQHAAALLDDHRRTFTLDALMYDRLGRRKLELPFAAKTIWQQPPELVADYARADARGTRDLWFSYVPDIEREELEKVLALEDDLIYSSLSMERTGTPLDMPKLERWDREILDEENTRSLDLFRRTGLRVNPNSGPEMVKLFKKLGLDHSGYTTEKGKESFPDDVLELFAGEWVGVGKDRRFQVTCPEVQLAREIRQLSSLRSKYTQKYLNGAIDGTLYYQLHQLRADEGGTITGRYASSGIEVAGTRMGGNIQQVKKPEKQEEITRRWIIRELFLPARGAMFLDADASQIEFRLMVHYANSARLIKAYKDNPDQDFHQLVTDLVLQNCMSRTLAKNFNFMKVYGGGVGKVMLMTGLDEVSATDMDRKYKRMFPEAGRLLNVATKTAERRGYVKTFLNRRRRYVPGDRYYSALNSVLQGTAADLMKLAILQLYRECRKILRLRATVHDEVIGDVQTKKDAKIVAEVLNQQRLPIRVPITWEVGTGKNWKEAGA
jgi:DNA polymerase-1